MTKERTVLIFGYPLAIQHLGGLVWIKKVVNYVDKSGNFCVKKLVIVSITYVEWFLF